MAALCHNKHTQVGHFRLNAMQQEGRYKNIIGEISLTEMSLSNATLSSGVTKLLGKFKNIYITLT